MIEEIVQQATTTTTVTAIAQQSSLSEASGIASAIAAVVSVLVAAYVYLASKREGPDIRYEDEPFVLGLVADKTRPTELGAFLDAEPVQAAQDTTESWGGLKPAHE